MPKLSQSVENRLRGSIKLVEDYLCSKCIGKCTSFYITKGFLTVSFIVIPLSLSSVMEGPRPVVLSGPSGAGKSTLMKMLLRDYDGVFGFSVSRTFVFLAPTPISCLGGSGTALSPIYRYSQPYQTLGQVCQRILMWDSSVSNPYPTTIITSYGSADWYETGMSSISIPLLVGCNVDH